MAKNTGRGWRSGAIARLRATNPRTLMWTRRATSQGGPSPKALTASCKSGDDPRTDPIGTVRVFPGQQDAHHPCELAIKWCSPRNLDEAYPWLILDSDGPQRLSNDVMDGRHRISLWRAVRELRRS